MGILERFEQRVDRLVNGALIQAHEAEVQPIEIAAALLAETDDSAMIVGAGKTVAPNSFAIDLSPTDYERLMPFERPLRSEFASVIKEHVNAERYSTLGGFSVAMAQDSALTTGVFRITATSVDDAGEKVEDIPAAVVRQGPQVVINGFAHPLTLQRTVFGRATDADIRIDDNGVSRRHFEILMGNPPKLHDLNSTNGTFILGERITEIALKADVDIKAGNTVIQFRLR